MNSLHQSEMTGAEHNIAYRKLEALEREVNRAMNALGAYPPDTNPRSLQSALARISDKADDARRYVGKLRAR